MIRNGRARKGETISFPLEDRVVKAQIVDPVFYDQEGKRLNG
jgi:sarcosine oxidase subunit alpha